MRRIMIAIAILLLLNVAMAQDSSIDIKHTGYGEDPRQLYFIIKNSGETTLKGITIYIDGEEYEKIKGSFGPGIKIEKSIFLQPGEHLIEVKTEEGAYDSVAVNTPSTPKEKPTPKMTEKIPSEIQNRNQIILVMFILLLVIILWIISKKPRLSIFWF